MKKSCSKEKKLVLIVVIVVTQIIAMIVVVLLDEADRTRGFQVRLSITPCFRGCKKKNSKRNLVKKFLKFIKVDSRDTRLWEELA